MLTQRILAIAQTGDQVVLWVLLILSVVSIGIIIERYFAIKKVSKDSTRMQERVKMALQSYSFDDVEEMSHEPYALEGRALSSALRHLKETKSSNGLEEIFNTFTGTERPALEKNLGFLATVGSTAPFIGLLGTVLGIMKAFNDLAVTPDAGQQTVMAGISFALVATAVGLFVAIPAVISYNFYQRKVRGIFQSIDTVKELCLAYAKKKGL